ncbi:MAG: hypothetical protein V1899_09375 [Planctomycetota bacterium]
MRRAEQVERGRRASRISEVDTVREPDEVSRRPPQADFLKLFSDSPLIAPTRERSDEWLTKE